MLHWATTLVSVGGFYRHYKDPMAYYMVTGLCILEATDEVAVRYKPAGKGDIEFVRPIAEWLDVLEFEDGEQIRRFTKLS